MKLTKAVTHIKIQEANPGKLAALDALAQAYMLLCQQYVTLFCTERQPDKFATPIFHSPLSQRWQRVAIQQAAGIAQSWRANRDNAYRAYLEELSDYEEQKVGPKHNPQLIGPLWKEWNTPILKATSIQANINVVKPLLTENEVLKLEPSEKSRFDYWLRVSTLESGRPLLLPVMLSKYHKKMLEGRKANASTTLSLRKGRWWLTLTFDEYVSVQTPPEAPAVGVDVGIANFITTSTGKRYGTFHGKLAERHKRDREKRRRKAKLRACLEKKGTARLPSTASRTGQRLARHVRQEINRAVNQFFDDHPGFEVAFEHLNVAGMKFKARAMNAYLYASNLAHIPKHLAWVAAKRGQKATRVKSAYSSQECNACHYTDRANRPTQQTFCCVVCGYKAHADDAASLNIQRRLGDRDLSECKDKAQIKALLLDRHHAWRRKNGYP